MSAPDNPSAFPEVPGDCNAYEGRPGMTLRDWFAGQALAGRMNLISFPADPVDLLRTSKNLYEVADAMLAAREEAVPAAQWKDWGGGACPLGHVYVEVRYRDGITARGDACEFDPAAWRHETGKFDIVAYRKVQVS